MWNISSCISSSVYVQVEGIQDVHELHVWQLTATRIIATIHIRCRSPSDYTAIAVRVNQLFHDEGIHSITVQPEFADMVCYMQHTKRTCLKDNGLLSRRCRGLYGTVICFVVCSSVTLNLASTLFSFPREIYACGGGLFSLPANNTTPAFYLCKRSPDCATTDCSGRHLSCSLLLIYQPQKDESLSRPGWLTDSRQFTRISGHHQLQVDQRAGKVRQRPTLVTFYRCATRPTIIV